MRDLNHTYPYAGLYPVSQPLRFNRFIDGLSDLVVAIDLDGYFVYINHATTKLLGFHPEEMLGRTYLDFIVETDRNRSQQETDLLIRGENTPGFFNYYYTKNGSIVPISWSGYWDAKERVLFYMGKEASERLQLDSLHMQYEQKLKKHNQQMVDILERITDGFFALDQDDRIIYWNQQAVEILNKKREDVLSRNIWECFEGEIDLTFFNAYEKARHTGQAITIEAFYNTLNNWFETTIAPSVTGISVFFKDITHKKQAEEELRLLSLIAKETVNAIIITDLNGRITWVNEAFYKTTGYSAEEVIGKLPGPLLSCPEKDQEVKRYLDEKVRTRESFQLEIQNRKKDGGTFWWHVSYQPLYDKEGRVERFVSVNTDITERKLLQQKLDKERQHFQKQLTAAAVVASEAERAHVGRELHDNVNQVLTTVKLYTELLASGVDNSQELLQRSSTLLQVSIDEIRMLSKRLSAPTLGDIGIKETLTELTESFAVAKAINCVLDAYTLEAYCLSKELHLAVYRIAQEQLTNISKHAKAANVMVALSWEGNELLLEIIDDGCGFNPKKKASGIGIANMTSRAEMLDGTLKISSAPGKGCIVKALFPVVLDKKSRCLHPLIK